MTNNNCVFCNYESLAVLCESETMYLMMDEYPVSKGHMLVIPKRHVKSFFDMLDRELFEMYQLLQWGKNKLRKQYHPSGYNIGINEGKVAGQTIMHLNIHLIPRYEDDVDNPIGGIRGVIPDKKTYK